MTTDSSVQRLAEFIATREARKDWSSFLRPDLTGLHLGKLSTVAGFARSAIYQNPLVKRRIAVLEDNLRARGVLKVVDDRGATRQRETTASVTEQELQDLANRIEAIKGLIADTAEFLDNYENQVKRITSEGEFK